MKVVFLDIDGVIQSTWQQNRFEHSHDEIWSLCRKLTKKYDGVFDYEKWAESEDSNNFWTVAAVYWDWMPNAVTQLKRVLDTTGAKIVLSSDWRSFQFDAMKALFRIHGLDEYYVDNTIYCHIVSRSRVKYRENFRAVKEKCTEFGGYRYVEERSLEIRDYLDRHPEVTGYTALDDLYLERMLEGHFVYCKGKLGEEEADKAIAAINSEGGPFPLPEVIRKMPELKEMREIGLAPRDPNIED